MPTRKIADLPEVNICHHSDHNPPNMRVFEPGVYEHECPRCGKKQIFTVKEGLKLITKSKVEPDMSADYTFGYDWASLRR